jgi:hypothetical protein
LIPLIEHYRDDPDPRIRKSVQAVMDRAEGKRTPVPWDYEKNMPKPIPTEAPI